jgi:hypothetical protein
MHVNPVPAGNDFTVFKVFIKGLLSFCPVSMHGQCTVGIPAKH